MFAKYVSLSILGMLAISCYIIADTLFIERAKGADGLAALNFAIPMFNVMNAVGLMIGVGWSARFAIQKGGGDNENADATFTQGFKFAIAAGLIFTFLGVFFSGTLASVMGAEAGSEIHRMTAEYLRVLLSFSPLFMLNSLMSGFVRNDGAPHFAMAATVTGSMANILFDYIFIFTMKLGMFGASLATGFSPLISLIVISFYFIRRKNGFRFSRKRSSAAAGVKNCSLGFSSLLSEISAGIVVFCFNRVVLKLAGSDGVAAYGIIANTAMVATAVFNGLAQGMQPLTGRFYGEGKSDIVRSCYRMTVITGLFISAAVYAAAFVFAESIAAAFNSEGNTNIADMAVTAIRLYFPAVVPLGFNTVSAIYYASVDNAAASFLTAALRGLIFIVPSIFILSALFALNGVWLSLFTAETLTAAVVIVYNIIKGKKSIGEEV